MDEDIYIHTWSGRKGIHVPAFGFSNLLLETSTSRARAVGNFGNVSILMDSLAACVGL